MQVLVKKRGFRIFLEDQRALIEQDETSAFDRTVKHRIAAKWNKLTRLMHSAYSGSLYVRTQGSRWKKRFVVIDGDHLLVLKSKRNRKEVKQSFALESGTFIATATSLSPESTPSKPKHQDMVFSVAPLINSDVQPLLELRAESPEAARHWIERLKARSLALSVRQRFQALASSGPA